MGSNFEPTSSIGSESDVVFLFFRWCCLREPNPKQMNLSRFGSPMTHVIRNNKDTDCPYRNFFWRKIKKKNQKEKKKQRTRTLHPRQEERGERIHTTPPSERGLTFAYCLNRNSLKKKRRMTTTEKDTRKVFYLDGESLLPEDALELALNHDKYRVDLDPDAWMRIDESRR